MSDKKIRTMVLAAVLAALACVATMVVQIPSPMNGYVNLGDRWIEERMAAVRALSFHSFDDLYFALGTIPFPPDFSSPTYRTQPALIIFL